MKDDDDALRALYRAARSEEDPKPEDRRAVRAALAGAFATTLAVHGAVAAPAAAKLITLGTIAGWVSLGAALGMVGSSTVMVARSRSHHEAVPSSAHCPATVPSARGPTVPAGQVDPANSVVAAPVETERPVAPVRASGERQGASLLDETRGLADVEQALSRHEAERALGLLNEQETLFRDGALGQERAAARVLALCEAGRRAEAEAARARFVSAYPDSPLRKRVLGTCAP
jgi:hypothetical protein